MTSPRREVYRHWQMRRLIAPESVAIIGASQNPAAYGSATFRNMARYTGRVHFVNARYDRIGDLPCWPSIAALPETPDCVIVAVPREAVEGLVAECAARGVGGVVIFSAGFAESGRPELIDLQARIVAIAREADMRLVGPNCMGISNFPLGFSAVFIHEAGGRDAGTPAVGLASQSGAMGNALSQALHRGVPLSHVLTAGNSCDVDVADYVSYLAEDPSCQSIGCVFEWLADPERMLQAAEIARVADNPVVVHNLARGGQA
ncbi:MAG: CoA-binding protein, partial [Gammaproteobacteria bacterium]